jgi:predicted RNA-binding Zn-ribbon protein involved in translation (DUF1610 family)
MLRHTDSAGRVLTALSSAEWDAEARRLFGPDPRDWRFVCPSCGHVAAVRDWRAAGAPRDAVAVSCVGRWLEQRQAAFSGGPGPCDYAGTGLFKLNPVRVKSGDRVWHMFAFADPPAWDPPA